MSLTDERDLPDGVKRIISILRQQEIPWELHAFEEPAHHAHEAAALLDCPLSAVVKSLVFQADATGEIFLVLVSGENRADIDLLHSLIGQPVHPASPEIVQRVTGYPVGAVPPFGLDGDYRTIMDADLMTHKRIWSSAGAVRILLGVTPQALQKLSQGRVECIKYFREET